MGDFTISVNITKNTDKNIFTADDIIYIDHPVRGNFKKNSDFFLKLYKPGNSISDIILSTINNNTTTWIDNCYFSLKKLDPIKVERKRLFGKRESATLIDSLQIIPKNIESYQYTGGWKYRGEEISGGNYDYVIIYSDSDFPPKTIPEKTIFCNLPNSQYILLPINTDKIDVLEIVDENELLGLNYKDYNYISDPSSIEKIINSTLI